MFHFPQAENSTCALASPLPTKAIRLCGDPLGELDEIFDFGLRGSPTSIRRNLTPTSLRDQFANWSHPRVASLGLRPIHLLAIRSSIQNPLVGEGLDPPSFHRLPFAKPKERVILSLGRSPKSKDPHPQENGFFDSTSFRSE